MTDLAAPLRTRRARQQRQHVRAKAPQRRPTWCSSTSRTRTAPAFKEESRDKAIAALNELDWGRTARAIRINGLDTQWCHDDVVEVVTKAGENLDTIIIPKARYGHATSGGSTCCSPSSKQARPDAGRFDSRC